MVLHIFYLCVLSEIWCSMIRKLLILIEVPPSPPPIATAILLTARHLEIRYHKGRFKIHLITKSSAWHDFMNHCTNDIQVMIKAKGQRQGTVTGFKYIGSVVSYNGSKPEVLSRIAQATAAITKRKPILGDQGKGAQTRYSPASSTLEQLFHIVEQLFRILAQNQKFSQGLFKPLQLLQSGRQFGEAATYQ